MQWIRSRASLLISLLALCMSLASFFNFSPSSTLSEREFAKKILANVRSCVAYNDSIFQKEDICELLNVIERRFQVSEVGSDDIRVKFVHAQGCIEHSLACFQALGEIDQLIGVIHTPTPATPLCVKPEGPVAEVLDESIRSDLAKLLTVRSRAQIVREYLLKGGKLYIVYPQGGLERRTQEQQRVYKEELERFSGSLFDWVLSTNKMSEEMIGATYLLRNRGKQVFAFSIKARQANDVQPQAEWAIWFGPVAEEAVIQRVNTLFDYLSENDGPDLRKELSL